MLRTKDIFIELADVGMASPRRPMIDAQRLLDWLDDGDDTAVIAEVAKSPQLLFQGVIIDEDEKRSLLLHILHTGNYALKSGIFTIACKNEGIFNMYQATVDCYLLAKSNMKSNHLDTEEPAQTPSDRKLRK